MPRLGIETLECRVNPASTITILDSGIGTLDGFLSPTDGTLLASDGGNVPGTLSRAALQGVNSTTDISIASQGSITFDALSSSLALQTGGGHGATFTAGTADAGDITFTNPANILSTGGGGLSFQATNATGGALSLGSLSASSFSATATGNIDITSVTATGAITLTSSTGSVSSTGTLQTASQLTLNAAAGITVFTSAVTLEATNSLSGDIAVTQTAPPSQLLTITNAAGGVVNNALGGAISIVADNLDVQQQINAAPAGSRSSRLHLPA